VTQIIKTQTLHCAVNCIYVLFRIVCPHLRARWSKFSQIFLNHLRPELGF